MTSPQWQVAKNYTDILYHKADGIAKVTINRPERRNAFRPETVAQMIDAFSNAREDPSVGVVLLTGAGPHTDGKYAFCAGGDHRHRIRSLHGFGRWIFLICNNTHESMDTITKNPRWLKAQVPFADLSEKIRPNPLVIS